MDRQSGIVGRRLRLRTNELVLRRCFFLAAAMLFSAASLHGDKEDVELRIKAAYLLNFARFVEWPRPWLNTAEPVVIAILGHDSVIQVLETTVQGKTIKGHPIKVKELGSLDRIDGCGILFIPRSETKRARSLLTDLATRPILTVGETSGFLGQGGIIEFQLIDDALRFSINLGSADRAGLNVSSELLRVAYSITGKRK